MHVLWRTDMSVAPTFTIFSDELSILNSSINFIIYSATSSYFRKRLSKVCCHLSLLLPGYYEVWWIWLHLCRCLRVLRIGSIHLWTNPQEGQRTGRWRELTTRDKVLQPRSPNSISEFFSWNEVSSHFTCIYHFSGTSHELETSLLLYHDS